MSNNLELAKALEAKSKGLATPEQQELIDNFVASKNQNPNKESGYRATKYRHDIGRRNRN